MCADFLDVCRRRRRRSTKARNTIRKSATAPPIAIPIIAPLDSAEGCGFGDIFVVAKVSGAVVASIELEGREVEAIIVVLLVETLEVLDSVMLDFEALVIETMDDFAADEGEFDGFIEAIV